MHPLACKNAYRRWLHPWLRHTHRTLGLLLSAGLAPHNAARAAYPLDNFVTEFVADEVRHSLAAEAIGASRQQLFAETRGHFRALPPDEYPSLTRLADYVADDDSDGLFRFGLELWIGALERLQKPGA